MDKVHIDLGANSYDVIIDRGLIGRTGKEIKDLTGAKKAVILTEAGLDRLYGQDLKAQLEAAGTDVLMMVLSPHEKTRNLSVVKRVYESLADFGIERTDLLVALGGRVVGDVTGFVAATFHRGMNYVQVPTSLLAQIGSAIGGKVSIDLGKKKSLIGAFYYPKAVYVDPDLVKTLPLRYVHNGLGEAVKVGCVSDKELFEIFEKAGTEEEIFKKLPEIIRRCIEIKSRLVEADPADKKERRILDFGHAIGRAAESYYRFDDQTLTHGEATAAGMYMMTTASEMLGLTEKGTAERIEKVLKFLGLPTSLDIPAKDLGMLIEANGRFGKDTGEIPLLMEIGKGYLYKGDIEKIRKYLGLD